jgi:hypothetical protein
MGYFISVVVLVSDQQLLCKRCKVYLRLLHHNCSQRGCARNSRSAAPSFVRCAGAVLWCFCVASVREAVAKRKGKLCGIVCQA